MNIHDDKYKQSLISLDPAYRFLPFSYADLNNPAKPVEGVKKVSQGEGATVPYLVQLVRAARTGAALTKPAPASVALKAGIETWPSFLWGIDALELGTPFKSWFKPEPQALRAGLKSPPEKYVVPTVSNSIEQVLPHVVANAPAFQDPLMNLWQVVKGAGAAVKQEYFELLQYMLTSQHEAVMELLKSWAKSLEEQAEENKKAHEKAVQEQENVNRVEKSRSEKAQQIQDHLLTQVTLLRDLYTEAGVVRSVPTYTEAPARAKAADKPIADSDVGLLSGG